MKEMDIALEIFTITTMTLLAGMVIFAGAVLAVILTIVFGCEEDSREEEKNAMGKRKNR